MIEPLPVPVPPKAGIEYRELSAEEIQSVAHVFEATGNSLPNPAISTFVGAVEVGKVIGFLVIQAKVHAEPMWISEGKSQIFGTLAKKAEEVVLQRCGPSYVYLFTPAGKVSQLASVLGFQIEPFVIMSKLVMPNVPARPIIDLLPMPEETKPEPVEDAPFDIRAAYEATKAQALLETEPEGGLQ